MTMTIMAMMMMIMLSSGNIKFAVEMGLQFTNFETTSAIGCDIHARG